MQQLSPTMQVAMALSAVQSRFTKRFDSQLSIHGISFTEFLVMQSLSKAPNKTMRRIELAQTVNLTASGVTRLLLPMEKIKLVEKELNPRDARVSLVKLTITGENLLKDAMVGFEQSSDQLLDNLSQKQISKLKELIDQIA